MENIIEVGSKRAKVLEYLNRQLEDGGYFSLFLSADGDAVSVDWCEGVIGTKLVPQVYAAIDGDRERFEGFKTVKIRQRGAVAEEVHTIDLPDYLAGLAG